MKYLVDSYALIAWFRERNENYKEYFEEIEEIGGHITLSVLMESYFCIFHNAGKEPANIFKTLVKPNFKVLRVNQELVMEAAEFRSLMLKKKKKMSYTDCILYIVAKRFNLRVLTGNENFKDLDHVEFVK
jgi:predicted nucleic acid-binding protein